MAKWKPAQAKKPAPPKRGAVPCVIFLASGMVLLLLLFYFMLKGGS